MNNVSLPVLMATLTEEILPREVVVNGCGVYLHTWVLVVYNDDKGCYYRIYLCRKNGVWASTSAANGRLWGYTHPLWDGDFIHATLDDALMDAWKDFDRVEERFHEKPKFYEKARKAFDEYMALPYAEKLSRLVIRD